MEKILLSVEIPGSNLMLGLLKNRATSFYRVVWFENKSFLDIRRILLTTNNPQEGIGYFNGFKDAWLHALPLFK